MEKRNKATDFVFGMRAVAEALESDNSIDKLLVKKELGGEQAKEILARARELGIPVQRVPVERINRITMKNHQGIVAMMTPVRYHKLENLLPELFEKGEEPFLICLDGVTDIRNFGAIGRTADCAGVSGIVIPERNSVSVTPDAMKTSAGGLLYVPVCRERDMLTSIRMLKESGVKVVGTTGRGAVPYTDVDYKMPVAIVMGNEENGISQDVLRLCDELVYIPQCGHIDSLNVSVAAGVLMYEVVRQRGACCNDR